MSYMPSVTFRLPPTLHERFVAYCEAKDVRPSELLRLAVERFIDIQDEPPLQPVSPGPPRSPRRPSAAAEVITGRQLLERQSALTMPRAPYGSRLKVKK